MRKIKMLAFIAIIMICNVPQICAAESPIFIDDPKQFLTYADLAIRGIIYDYKIETIKVKDWIPDVKIHGDDPYPITILYIDILEVLRGMWTSDTISVVLPGGYPNRVKHPIPRSFPRGVSWNYEKGQESIITLFYSKRFLGGSYIVDIDRGRYIRRGDLWENQADKNLVSIDSLRAWARRGKFSRVLANSDLVAKGRIDSVSPGKGPGKRDIATIRMTNVEVWKGDYPGTEIEFRVARVGGYELQWFAPIPDTEPGEEWLIFFKRYNDGYHPFMGKNGMFKLVKGKLLYTGKIPYKLNEKEMARKVREVIKNEE